MWWQILVLAALLIACCFGLVLLNGAPYLPSLNKQIAAALKLAALKPGDTLIELGCGDGRVLIAAAEKGYKAVGYEINPIMFAVCWLRTWKWRRSGKIRLVFRDYWQQTWPPAEAIYVFLLPRLMDRLEQKIKQEMPQGIKVVSFAFKFNGLQPQKELDGVFLYSL